MSDITAAAMLQKYRAKSTDLKTESGEYKELSEDIPMVPLKRESNKQNVTSTNTGKLDDQTENWRDDKVPLEVGKMIMQGRHAMGLSQKDLSVKISEKLHVITDYEAGRAILNIKILAKIERVIGIKLRGKDRGQPLLPPGKK